MADAVKGQVNVQIRPAEVVAGNTHNIVDHRRIRARKPGKVRKRKLLGTAIQLQLDAPGPDPLNTDHRNGFAMLA